MADDGSFAFTGAPTPEELARFDLTDLGNAKRLIRLVGGQFDDAGGVDARRATLLFLIGFGWVGFNGRFWDRELGDQLAQRTAHMVATKMRGLFHELSEAHQGVTPKEVMKFIDSCGNRGSLSAMLSVGQPYLTVRIDDFDQHKLAINCKNGTLWLEFDRSAPAGKRFRATLRDHDPADRLTRCAAIDYDAKAEAPHFQRVLADALRQPDERAAFGRMMGYGVTGFIHEQAFFFVQGKGRDGKSTLLDACRETMGTYAGVGKPETFLDGGPQTGSGPQPDIVALAGDTRFAVVSEPKRGSRLNEGMMKAWTSGSPITARDLNAKPITFRPTTKQFWEMNSLVVTRGDDDGIWRRMHLALFRHQVPPDQVDKLLPDKLRAEAAGILNWLVAGVADWLDVGLAWPEGWRDALENYRRASSPFGDWLQERCVWGEAAKGARTLAGDLYGDFKTWAEDQGHDKIMSQRSFGDGLTDRQVMVVGKNGVGKKYRGPIRLKTPDELAADVEAAEAAAAQAGALSGPSGAGGTSLAGQPGDVPEPGSFDGSEEWSGQ